MTYMTLVQQALDLFIDRLAKAMEENKKLTEALKYYAVGNKDFGELARRTLMEVASLPHENVKDPPADPDA